MRRIGLILLICWLTQIRAETFSTKLFHQSMKEALVSDSVVHNKTNRFDTVFTDKPLKNPLRPMMMSLIIPGLGQLDNGKKWKALGFFLGEGALLGYILYLDHTNDPRRSDFTWYLALVHTFNVMDAVVDAYLYGFDEMLPEKEE